MSADIYPDHIAAVIARLRANSAVMALAPDEVIGGSTVKRVGGRLVSPPKSWEGKHAVVILDAGGLPAEMPLSRPRVTVLSYGYSGLEASRVARTVAAALVPLDTQSTQFIAAGCVVTNVQRAGGLIPLTDPQTAAAVRAQDFMLLVNLAVGAL